MNEEAARAWIEERFGAARTTLLERYARLLIEENSHQNLIGPSTIPLVWQRHLLDSAQLLPLAGDHGGSWLDIGSGAGLPGMVVAVLSDRPIILVEPRKRRATFLEEACQALDLSRQVRVVARRIETMPAQIAAVISARAVAAPNDLFAAAQHCADMKTIWLLPKGRSTSEEVAVAKQTWHGAFHVEQSLTQTDSSIIVAREISRR